MPVESDISIISGAVLAAILLALVFTGPIARFLLWQYKQESLAGMYASANANKAVPSPKAKQTPQTPLLDIQTSVVPKKAQTHYAERELHAIGVVYTIAGLVYTVLMALIFTISSDSTLNTLRVVSLAISLFWPAIVCLLMVIAVSQRQQLLLLGSYLVTFAIFLTAMVLLAGAETLKNQTGFWAIINTLPTILIAPYLRRRIRAVGPLIAIILFFAFSGAAGIIVLTADYDPATMVALILINTLGLGLIPGIVVVIFVGFASIGVLGWLCLLWLGKRYQQRKFSDHILITDSIWFTFTISHALVLSHQSLWWASACFVIFMIYKLTTYIGFSLLNRTRKQRKQLLLLRVFSLGKRSEDFFQGFSKWWRTIGDITMISGPDLATSIVEPDEFLQFLNGHHTRQFVKNSTDLESKLATIELTPDYDGRFRIHEFFCHDDTWRLTMQALTKQSDAILMDLRSFSAQNSGCEYEIEQLLDIADLNATVFLVDHTTDISFLETTLQKYWQQIAVSSPNISKTKPVATLFFADKATRHTINALHNLLAA